MSFAIVVVMSTTLLDWTAAALAISYCMAAAVTAAAASGDNDLI